MAESILCESHEEVTLREYVEHLKHEVNVFDNESLLQSAPMFAALANNRRVMLDALHEYLKNTDRVEESNTYSSQSMLLAVEEKFFLRANVWVKPSRFGGTTSWEDTLYSYHMPHNHNFDFLTVGYFGSGYRTEIFELQNCDEVVGFVGESVDLEFLEHTSLPKGKVMLYRRFQDVHTQLPPDDLSISMNVMVNNREAVMREQYEFDVESGTIARIIPGSGMNQAHLLSMAALVGDETTFDLAMFLARSSPNPRTRLGASVTAIRLNPGMKEQVLSAAMSDKSALVRQVARGELGILGSR